MAITDVRTQGDNPDKNSGEQSRHDLCWQKNILQDVSRTFAFTIPALPDELECVVSNAYLLCRIADTIEDDCALSAEKKKQFSESFIHVVSGSIAASDFVATLLPALSSAIPLAERELVQHTEKVIRITCQFDSKQRNALERCIRIMAKGMADYQNQESLTGLMDIHDTEQYCYYVAGVVGEMLTELFCIHSPIIARQKQKFMQLAVNFGLGLQLTNILKDIWEDHNRGACWLPRNVFSSHGFDITEKSLQQTANTNYTAGIQELVGLALYHLRGAIEYTLAMPQKEVGIRRFCLLALIMAILTLRKIYAKPQFRSGKEVKISRNSVRFSLFICRFFPANNRILRIFFNIATRHLPTCQQNSKFPTT